MHISSPQKGSVFHRRFAEPARLKKKMKGQAHEDDFQGQAVLKKKKKKKKRKHEESSSQAENDGSTEGPELSQDSSLLFDSAAAQGEESSKERRKAKKKHEKQQASIADYFVRLEQGMSNGAAAEASRKKKRKDKDSEVTCVSVNQASPGGCQDTSVDYVYLEKPPKKKKKKKEGKLSQVDEECEMCVSENQASPGGCQDTSVDYVYLEKPPKKKKKKKEGKLSQVDEECEMCVSVNQASPEGCQDTSVDYVYLEKPPKKKKKKKEGKLSQVDEECEVCVSENQASPEGCQDTSVDYVHLEKPPKKKKKKKKEGKLSQVDEECEVPPPESQGENNREKAKKKKRRRDSSAQDRQEDTEGTAEQSLSSPGQNRPGGAKGRPLAAEEGQRHQEGDSDGDSDAASATSELTVDVPADCSTPNKAANGAQKPPAYGRKTIKSKPYISEESSSESDEATPEPLASNKEKQQNGSFAITAASDEVSLDDEDDVLDSAMYTLDLDTAKKELEEFIPHVRNISDSSIRKMAGRDLARFKEFKKQGIAIKFGRFTKKENEQLQKNVDEFLSITGIDSAEKLLFTSRYPEEKETISSLKVEHHFCAKISEGIPRPWRLIYYRARKMFDPNNYKGRYTKEEKEKLKKYHALHGNNWKKISELMSRSNLSVAMKFSEIKSPVNYGPWTREETQKLKLAVKEVMKRKLEKEDGSSLSSLEEPNGDLLVKREKLCQQLPWTEIETKVGSRYWRQCKQKWHSILAKKMSKGQQSERRIEILENKIALIKRLHEMNVEDMNEINWEELSDAIGAGPNGVLQAQFYRLKVSCVPLWQKKTFSEIIDFIVEHKLPEFEKQLRKQKKEHHSSGNSSASQEKKAFRLSEIFDSSEESD